MYQKWYSCGVFKEEQSIGVKVSIFEYDEEEHMRQEREESRQESFEQMGELIVKLNQLGRQDDILKVATDC